MCEREREMRACGLLDEEKGGVGHMYMYSAQAVLPVSLYNAHCFALFLSISQVQK